MKETLGFQRDIRLSVIMVHPYRVHSHQYLLSIGFEKRISFTVTGRAQTGLWFIYLEQLALLTMSSRERVF
jgi:hypothetical protein